MMEDRHEDVFHGTSIEKGLGGGQWLPRLRCAFFRPLEHWDRELEYQSGHGCMFAVNILYCALQWADIQS
jgi:hypothetical protein